LNNLTIPGLLMIGVMGFVLLALHFLRIHQKRKNPPTPLTCDILRGPGQSLLTQIDSLNQEIQVYSIALLTIPILIFCAHISYSYFGGQPESGSRIAMSAGGTLVFMGCFVLKLIPRLARRRLRRLSYEGKVVAGQELICSCRMVIGSFMTFRPMTLTSTTSSWGRPA